MGTRYRIVKVWSYVYTNVCLSVVSAMILKSTYVMICLSECSFQLWFFSNNNSFSQPSSFIWKRKVKFCVDLWTQMHLVGAIIYLLSACSWFYSAENFHFVIHSTFGRYGSSSLYYFSLVYWKEYVYSSGFPYNLKLWVELFIYRIGLVKSSENSVLNW